MAGQKGILPYKAILSSTAAFYQNIPNLVQNKFTTKNGYEHNCKVINFNDESIIIKFGTENIEESMKLGEEAAKFISERLISPIEVKYQHIYFPFLLV